MIKSGDETENIITQVIPVLYCTDIIQINRIMGLCRIPRALTYNTLRLLIRMEFNFNLLKYYFELHGVNVEYVEETLPKTNEAELVEDMLSLMSSFSTKIYGKRSAERRKKK